MTLTILDFILLIILFFFAFAGFFFGLIRSVGSLIGTILGIVVAANYFQIFARWQKDNASARTAWNRIQTSSPKHPESVS